MATVTGTKRHLEINATEFDGQLDGTIKTDTTATTQSAGDNSTKVATTAYADAVLPSWVPNSNPSYLTSLGTAILDADFTSNGFMKRTGSGSYTVDTSTYLTGINSSAVTTALGFTPYNATNPSSYDTTPSWVPATNPNYLTAHQSLSAYATTSYVDTQISNLIDSSPALLNTLDELAAALGDDPNFATTVATSIGTKLPLAGGIMTGDIILNDNVEVEFGTGSDVKMKFDGSDLVTTVPAGSAFMIGTNGGTPNDNSGKADFVVDVNAAPQISLYSNQVQIGSTDMNWSSKLYYSSGTLLGSWDSDLTLFTQGSSGATAKNIILRPQAVDGSTTTVATFNGDTGTTLAGNASISGNLTFKPFHYAASADLDSDSRTIWSSHATNGTTSNRPINYSSVYTLGGSATNTLQISTNEDYSESGMWIRQHNNNAASPQGAGWQNWTEVWTTNKISAISDSISTTSSNVVASATAVKAAYDRGSTGIANAASAQATADAAVVEGGTTFNGEYPLVVRTSANAIYSHPSITFTGSTGILEVTGPVQATSLDINGNADISGTITSANGNFHTTGTYFQLNTPSGYIQMGAMNTSHAHMYTDRADFYFNKAISINGANVLTAVPETYFKEDDIVMNENPFGGRSLYNSMINNPWFLAADRYTVTQTGGTSIANAFNGDYESSYTVAANGTATFNIDFGQHPGYPYGWIYLSFYYTHQPSSISGRVYNNYVPHTVGWSALTFTDVVNTSGERIVKARQGKYGLTDLEITLTAPAGTTVRLTSCEIHLDRPGTQEMPVFNKFRPEKIYKDLTLKGKLLSEYTGSGTHELINASSNGTVLQLKSTGDNRYLYLQTDHIYSNGNLYIGDNSHQTNFRGSSYNFETGNSTFAGVLALPDGSVSAPSIGNTGDTNTGMYWPGDHQVGFAVNGSRKMYMSETKTYFQNQASGVEINNGITLVNGALSISGDGSNAVTLTESASGDFTIDAPDDIRFDAGGGDFVWRTGGTEFGRLSAYSNGLRLTTSVANQDMYLVPNGTGRVQVDKRLYVGANDTGHDVIFYGATSGKKMQWDESADTLIVDGVLDINGNADISGNLDVGGILHITKANATAVLEIQGGLTTITAADQEHGRLDFGANDGSVTGGIASSIRCVSEYSNGAHAGITFWTGQQSRSGGYLAKAMHIKNDLNVDISGALTLGTALADAEIASAATWNAKASTAYVDTAETDAIASAATAAESYADGLASNYATAAQGTLAASALQSLSGAVLTTGNQTIAGEKTFTGALTVNLNGDALNLRSTTNGQPANITFSTNVPDSQVGHIKYSHSNSASYAGGDSFTIGGTETTTVILADGQLMYKDGIYSKPATGTGAGTRKDANWDTAYTHSQAAHAPSTAEQNVQSDWNATSGDAFIDNKPTIPAAEAYTAHENISAATTNLDNSGRTYVQDITLDSNGHVTAVATATETVTDTTYSKASFDLDHLFNLVGAAADTSTNMGTYSFSSVPDNQTLKQNINALSIKKENFILALSDETSDLTTGTGKLSFRIPYAFRITNVRASLSTAAAGGEGVLTVDVNVAGTSIFSNSGRLTIDCGEKTSVTAASAIELYSGGAVQYYDVPDDREITFDIDAICAGEGEGSATGSGLKVTLIGYAL